MLLGWLPHMLNNCYSYLVCCYTQTTCGSCWVVSVLREGKHTSRYPSVWILLLFLFSLCPWRPLSSPHHPQFGDVSNLIRKEFVDAKSVLRDVTVGRILHCFSILWFQVFGTGQDHSRRRLQVQDGGLVPTRVLRVPQWAPLHIFTKSNSVVVLLQIRVQVGAEGRGLCGQEEAPCSSSRGNSTYLTQWPVISSTMVSNLQ